MLTAAAVVETAARGQLLLNAPIGRVVKGLDLAIAELTPHQLLSQTSSLRDMQGDYGDLGVPNIFEGGRYGFGLMPFQSRGLQVAEYAGSMVTFAALVRTAPAHRFGVIALANGDVPAIRDR
jgi:hypothetical protein